MEGLPTAHRFDDVDLELGDFDMEFADRLIDDGEDFRSFLAVFLDED